MRICFIQKQAFPYFGIASLSGYLKQAGIETAVLITNMEKDLSGEIRRIRPDIIGISLLSTEHTWLQDISREIKNQFPEIPIIVGGVHAVLYPQKILEVPFVDFICTGDGEKTLLEFCNCLKEGKKSQILALKGIGYRQGDKQIVNEREELFDAFEGYYDDREIYFSRYPDMRNDEQKQFSASRGCPYCCSFCFNEHISDIFKSKGRYIRVKSPGHFIAEIERVKETCAMKALFFADDLFAANRKWLREFIPLYKRTIAMPFMCTVRANMMDEETADLLKDGGCHTVTFGLETGNEALRSGILGKNVTDDHIFRCAKLLKARGIRIQTSNMFCLPGETVEDAFKTVQMNIQIKADFVYSTIFMPFPGTRLAQSCVAKGYLAPDFQLSDLPQSFLTTSVLTLKDKARIANVQRVSFWLIRFPWLVPLFRHLIVRFNFNKPYEWLMILGTFFRYKEERKISYLAAVRFLWRLRRSYK